MQSITLLKLGGSLITDKQKPYTIRKNTLSKLCSALTTFKKPLIISHGSGSFAHTSAKLYGGKKGYNDTYGITKVWYDAFALHSIVMDQMHKHQLPAVSIQPHSLFYTQSGNVKEHLYKIIEGLLRQRFIPVVYGDVLYDISWNTTIFSGEKIMNELAKYLLSQGYKINPLIQLINTYGFCSADNKTIPIITNDTWNNFKKCIYKNNSSDVTGGIEHKIQEALYLTGHDLPTIVANGNDIEEVKKCLLNKVSDKRTLIM